LAVRTRSSGLGRLVGILIVVGVVGLLVIQVIPYGRNHTNPAVRAEPAWASAETRQLAVATCFDCHSNQSVWPWWSDVAPASWLVQWDVERGRRKLNFSEWDRPQEDASSSAEQVRVGEMPPRYYLPLHPEAQLNAQQKSTLIAGLAATFGDHGGERGGRERD
jgi:heme-binding protein